MQKLIFTLCLALAGSLLIPAEAQQYKIKQKTGVMGMNSETTIYVKGKRKRTEPGAMMPGMPKSPTVIEQCDLQRYIKINDKKKLYFIEPFAKQGEDEIIDEDAPKAKTTPAKQATNTQTKDGGIITLYYSITDTGERKNMYGLTARHVWTYQKIKPSANACTMKDSIIIKTDGWYVDLPQWSCPVSYRPQNYRDPNAKPEKPTCQDKFVIRRKGKGKLGFALTETTTIIMAGMKQEMTTANETIEFSAARLDSMLFEIPLGYTETKNEEDLQDKFDPMSMSAADVSEMAKSMGIDMPAAGNTGEKKPGVVRIAVLAPTGDEQVTSPATVQARMVAALMGNKVEAVAAATEEEAQQYNCDYILSSVFTRIKAGSKVGGLLKAVKNADPNAASQFNIQANLTLKALSGDVKAQPSVDGKFEGKVDEAAAKAMEDGCRQVLKALK